MYGTEYHLSCDVRGLNIYFALQKQQCNTNTRITSESNNSSTNMLFINFSLETLWKFDRSFWKLRRSPLKTHNFSFYRGNFFYWRQSFIFFLSSPPSSTFSHSSINITSSSLNHHKTGICFLPILIHLRKSASFNYSLSKRRVLNVCILSTIN